TAANASIIQVEDSLMFYSTHGDTTYRVISQAVAATSMIIQKLMEETEYSIIYEPVAAYVHLQDRLFVMEALNDYDASEREGLGKINNLTSQLKAVLLKQFQETPWMNVKNEFGFDILSQYEMILDELTVVTDFDSFDRNLTSMRQINRDMSARCFEHSKRTTGCGWFDVAHSFMATWMELDEKYTKWEDWTEVERISHNFQYNAVNYVNYGTILILAPTAFPLAQNSTDATMLAFAGDIIGHELYHSFITEELLTRSDIYRSEAVCIQNHYVKNCKIFAEGDCWSGEDTFLEDGPDVEGLRAAYEMLKNTFTDEQLKELEYPELKISVEQSFFYSLAMRSCADVGSGEANEHSPDNIRVNALVSQMPEFTRAFECTEGDLLYAHPDEICYLFGANSIGKYTAETESDEND
ncbi:hypothetical protein PFISCL1PPCAC_17781, partial [Pristionchus fissidentatus]